MTGFALWNLGFRPFYLLASIFGAISVLLWAAQYSQLLPFTYLQGCLWYGHEMLFGYTMAFGIYAVRYWPMLTRPRRDGKSE
ncbi:MAG: NnrS family protein [Burkholderiales bacterium]